MTATIGNPLSWGAGRIALAVRHLASSALRLGSGEAGSEALPAIRRIGPADLRTALARGFADFADCRSDAAFLCLLYPVIGLVITWLALDRALLPLLFPVMSGFALVGPVAAVGLYAMSRRREAGETAGWADAVAVLRSPAFGAIFLLGLALLGVFVVWLLAARGVHAVTLGPEPPASLASFAAAVVGTGRGWAMIAIGLAVGFVFAAAVLAVSVVSFPLLLDRQAGIPLAVGTSIRVTRANPGAIALWGLIVAGALALGSLPLFLGLVVVLPVLGHATWHLYRATVDWSGVTPG
jgi:uncharacterized membrane protein